MAGGLVALFDDVAVLARAAAASVDDIGAAAGRASMKAAGVVVDDTAVVTAKLWLKGTRQNGEAFDYKLWFSDTYVRTPTGWRYFFGQAGAPLPR